MNQAESRLQPIALLRRPPPHKLLQPRTGLNYRRTLFARQLHGRDGGMARADEVVSQPSGFVSGEPQKLLQGTRLVFCE